MRAHIIGDLHGYFESYKRLLLNAEIIDEDLNWIAVDDQLWLIGDIFDRGNQAVKCVELTMKLATQADKQGGGVNCILGNHELMFLAARKFVTRSPMVVEQWRRWGGKDIEMLHISEAQVKWLETRPAMYQVGDHLLVHSDNLSYLQYGSSIPEVNQYFWNLIAGIDQSKWIQTLSEISQRRGFELDATGLSPAKQLLDLYGGRVLVHGHTPISLAVDIDAEEVTQAREYGNGICCNVDGGLYLGGPGFIYSFEID